MRRVLIGATLLALSGCTRNVLVLVFQGQPPPVGLACALGPRRAPLGGAREGGVPIGPVQELIAPHAQPGAGARAVAGGCAGVLFRLGPDGRPVDLRVVIESPPGFGFGDAALKAVAATRFKPDPADTGWHYMTVTEQVPAPRPPPPSPETELLRT